MARWQPFGQCEVDSLCAVLAVVEAVVESRREHDNEGAGGLKYRGDGDVGLTHQLGGDESALRAARARHNEHSEITWQQLARHVALAAGVCRQRSPCGAGSERSRTLDLDTDLERAGGRGR
eukprot:2011749-Prymnesium_polylepis.2